jgi:hypothetical protein
VTLNDVNRGMPGLTTTTDDSGTFRFSGVPAGRFDLQAFRNGFLRSSYGASRPDRAGTPIVVRDGESISNLTMTIVKGGVISGVVRDRQGQPLPDVTVRVLRRNYHATTGEATLSAPNGSVVSPTDDRGEYRAFGLPPGGYVVLASPGPSAGGRGAGDRFRSLTAADVQRAIQAARTGGPAPSNVVGASGVTTAAAGVGYVPIFHPNVTDISRATTVALDAGEERTGVDITTEMLATSTVSGRVAGPAGAVPPIVSISIVPAGPYAGMLTGAGIRWPTARPQPDGRFTIGGLTPGAYTVKATSSRPGDGEVLSAAVDVSVTGRDLRDVDVPLTLSRGVSINGRVVFTGASPTPAELQTLRFFLVPLNSGGAALYTGGGRGANPALAGGRVDAEGRFTFTNIPPDTYHVVWTWTAQNVDARWAITRMLANGRDAFEAPLRVTTGEPIDMTVSYTAAPSVLRGVFQDRAGRAAPDYYVLVYSADRAHWTPGSRRIRMTRPATDGAFELRGLPAGQYLVGALTELEPGEWNDPTLLEQLSKFAISVTLGAGQTTTQDVRLGG